MKCNGRSTRTGEIECPECGRTWDRGDEAPECKPAPVLDETGPGGVLNEKSVRLGLSYTAGMRELNTRMARTREGRSAVLAKGVPRD